MTHTTGPEAPERLFADELRKWWSFNDGQRHTHSWHDREDFIAKKLPSLLYAIRPAAGEGELVWLRAVAAAARAHVSEVRYITMEEREAARTGLNSPSEKFKNITGNVLASALAAPKPPQSPSADMERKLIPGQRVAIIGCEAREHGDNVGCVCSLKGCLFEIDRPYESLFAGTPSYHLKGIEKRVRASEVEVMASPQSSSLALAEFDTTRFCCFCGKDNTSGIVGYAGERTCQHCGKGGHGEPDEPQMAYKRNLSASPTVIEDFPGRKVEAHLRLFGKLPTARDEEASDLALAEITAFDELIRAAESTLKMNSDLDGFASAALELALEECQKLRGRR